MKNKKKSALCLLGIFFLWTAAICFVDVKAIGPQGSEVGFAGLNHFFHRLTGVHLSLYTLTDFLSLIPLGFIAGFALLGLVQWVSRKSLRKVDRSILVLGGFYLLVMAAYLAFERIALNYRPILIEGILEASYPSSTTVLVLCVIPTAAMQLNARIRHNTLRKWPLLFLKAFTLFMVGARAVSGVHWLTDIIGGILLSGALVLLYAHFSQHE